MTRAATDHPPRESQVSVASGEVVTAQRPLIEIPSSWLDRLVVAASDLPFADGETAVVRSLLGTLGFLLPECGIGACLVPADRGAQEVFKVTPPGEENRGFGVDPTRIFPGYAYERVVEIDGTTGGSTIHLAADDPSVCEDDRSPTVLFVARAALVMNRGLELARIHARASATSAELRALSSHMVQAEKLASLGQIAAGVVHELNNPLTSIVAYTEYLTRKTSDTDDLNRLRRINESANRMLRFTRDLVTYARPSSEVAVAVTIHHVIDQALAFCEHVLAEAGAVVERRFAEDVPHVRGMPEQLAQVFVNLVTNACHAMPSGRGHLVITTTVVNDGRTVVVTVDDNGHGVAPEHLNQIFLPFFTTKGEGRGTGLGLSIVKNIVDNHDGEIRAERLAPSGTRFSLVLPSKRRTVPAPPL